MAAADPPVYWPERKYSYGTAEAFNTVRQYLLCSTLPLSKEWCQGKSHTPCILGA